MTAMLLAMAGVFLLLSGAQTDRRTLYIDCGGTIAECESEGRNDPIVMIERDPVRLALGSVSLVFAIAILVVALRIRDTVSATSGSSTRTVGG